MSQIAKYIIDASTKLPLSASLGESITNRTSSSPKFIVTEGCTMNEFIPSSTSTTFEASLTSADAIVTPFARSSQTAVLPNLPTPGFEITENLLPSQSNLIYGVPNGTSGYVTTDSSDIHYGIALSNLSESSSSVLQAGTKIGTNNFNTPADLNIGEYYASGGDGFSQVGNLKFLRYAGTADTHGAKNTQRDISEWSNTVGGSGATDGYGSTATVAAVLAQLKYVSTVTVGQNTTDGKTMSFWVKKNTVWPGDFVIIDSATGEYMKGDKLPGIIDLETQLFLEDTLFDTSKWTIMDNMILTNSSGSAVTIPAGAEIATPITVAATFTATATGSVAAVDLIIAEINSSSAPMNLYFPSGTGDGSTDAGGANISLTGGTDRTDRDLLVPSLRFIIPPQTQYVGQYTVRPLTQLPGGFIFPKGTVLSSINDTNTLVQKKMTFDKVIMDENFNIEGDCIIGQVVTSNKKIEIPEGNSLLGPSTVPISASWTNEIPVEGAIVSDEYTTQGDMRLTEDLIVRSAITLARNSKLAARSILPTSALTADNMTVTDEVHFASQTSISSDFDFKAPIAIDEMTTSNGKTLVSGTIIRSNNGDSDEKTIIPTGMVLSNGSSTPGPIKISAADSVTLKPTLELKGGVSVGPSFTFTKDVQFEPETEFSPGTVFGAGAILPSGTSILKNSKFAFNFALPADTELAKATKMYSGTTFAPGSSLPATPCRIHENGDLPLIDTPFRIISQSGVSYIVYRSGTVFTSGFQITKGSILLATSGMGGVDQSTTVFNSSAYTSGAFVTDSNKYYLFDEGETKFLSGGSGLSLQSFQLDAGVASITGIQLRGEAVFAYDIAIPFIDSSTVFSEVSFNVDYVLTRDVTIDADYTVNGDNLMYWPSQRELPQDLIIAGELSITSDTTLTRKVKLPSAATFYLENILSATGSFIKMPNIATNLKWNVKIGDTALVIGQNSGESRSYLIAPTGMYVLSSYVEGGSTIQGLKVRSQVTLEQDWELLQDLTISPTFVAQGMFLPSGANLPGPLDVGSSVKFPRGLTLPNPAQLASAFSVGNLDTDTYSLPVLSLLAAGSIIKKGSIIATGSKFSNVILGPVQFNTSSGMFLLHGQEIPSEILYNYFHGSSVIVSVRNDNSAIQDLEMLVGAIQSQLSSHLLNHP